MSPKYKWPGKGMSAPWSGQSYGIWLFAPNWMGSSVTDCHPGLWLCPAPDPWTLPQGKAFTHGDLRRRLRSKIGIPQGSPSLTRFKVNLMMSPQCMYHSLNKLMVPTQPCTVPT